MPDPRALVAPVSDDDSGISASFVLFKAVPSYLLSFMTHVIMVIVMALITVSHAKDAFRAELVATVPEELEPLEDLAETEWDLKLEELTEPQGYAPGSPSPDSPSDSIVIADSPSTDAEPAPAFVELQTFGERTAPRNELMRDLGMMAGDGFSHRKQRDGDGIPPGASAPSEKAVALALQWLANHQNADGSFNFDHARSPQCGGKCGDRGSLSDCTTGGTALALLPFLGAGQTHKAGKYRKTVEAGLYYLLSRMKVQNDMGSLAEGGGNLYAHGIAAIVLCEAYGMTHDKVLAQPAQAALNYTMHAQDPNGGGWRYTARQPGDTSAVGWQLMALKSGHMAYLRVNPATIAGANRFLDSVQSDSGAKYGYTSPGAGPGTTSVGLLSRMYLGWKRDNPALQRGVEFLDAAGPSPNNFYFNYYATQVMRHNGGEPWTKWNEKMRDQLVASQAKDSHQIGSWFVKGGDHGAEAGGRLYCTAMAAMMLEVYYRHMPLYGKEAADSDFPL
jgi:hypothetical protein